MMIHKNLTLERWQSLTLFEQLANVGCDVDRVIRWRDRGNEENSTASLYRALELLDLTVADPKNRGAKRRELLRVREGLVDYFLYDNEYGSSDASWHNYFFAFNYAAALRKGK